MTAKRRDDLVIRTVSGETVVFDATSGRVHQLNATASVIWNFSDGMHSIDDIAARLAENFEDAPQDVASETQATVLEFERLRLLAGTVKHTDTRVQGLIMRNLETQQSRGSFVRRTAYVTPAVLTLHAIPAFATIGSRTSNNGNLPANDGPGIGSGNPGSQAGLR